MLIIGQLAIWLDTIVSYCFHYFVRRNSFCFLLKCFCFQKLQNLKFQVKCRSAFVLTSHFFASRKHNNGFQLKICCAFRHLTVRRFGIPHDDCIDLRCMVVKMNHSSKHPFATHPWFLFQLKCRILFSWFSEMFLIRLTVLMREVEQHLG